MGITLYDKPKIYDLKEGRPSPPYLEKIAVKGEIDLTVRYNEEKIEKKKWFLIDEEVMYSEIILSNYYTLKDH